MSTTQHIYDIIQLFRFRYSDSDTQAESPAAPTRAVWGAPGVRTGNRGLARPGTAIQRFWPNNTQDRPE
jgi:hypothetical protein